MRGRGFCDNTEVHGPGGKVVRAACPECGRPLAIIAVAVDLIVEHEGKLWLVRRKGGGYSLPGGFVEMDETLEQAAAREAREELGAGEVSLVGQFHTYGDPWRDPRRRVVSVAYVVRVDRIAPSPRHLEADGLEGVEGFAPGELPPLVFDHEEVVADYLATRRRLEPLARRRGG